MTDKVFDQDKVYCFYDRTIAKHRIKKVNELISGFNSIYIKPFDESKEEPTSEGYIKFIMVNPSPFFIGTLKLSCQIDVEECLAE